MAIASLFKNGRNQAVRLPKELEFSGVSKVEVRKEGNSIIITPVRKTGKVLLIQHSLMRTSFMNVKIFLRRGGLNSNG